MPITQDSIEKQRQEIRHLIDVDSPHQARLAHYALEHSASRSQMSLYRPEPGAPPTGFLVTCITGLNPFQPVVVFEAPDEDAAGQLLQETLTPGRPYLFLAQVTWAGLLDTMVTGQTQFDHILKLDPGRFEPVVNVFVRLNNRPEAPLRAYIESQGRTVAQAGVNWQGTHRAEVYVSLDPAARGREWARSVLAALSGELLKRDTRPVYCPPAELPLTTEFLEAAARVGYVDTGRRMMEISGTLKTV